MSNLELKVYEYDMYVFLGCQLGKQVGKCTFVDHKDRGFLTCRQEGDFDRFISSEFLSKASAIIRNFNLDQSFEVKLGNYNYLLVKSKDFPLLDIETLKDIPDQYLAETFSSWQVKDSRTVIDVDGSGGSISVRGLDARSGSPMPVPGKVEDAVTRALFRYYPVDHEMVLEGDDFFGIDSLILERIK